MKNCVNNFTKIAMKSLMVVLLLALSFMGVFSAPLMSVAQTFAATNYNDFIASGLKLIKLPNSCKLGQKVAIPFGETENAGDIINVKILSPKGEVVFDNLAADLTVYNKVAVDSANKVYNLTPDKVGTYKVQYSIESVVSGKKDLATQEFKIVVTGNKATMEFEENSKYIIPSVANENYQIVLPNPSVKDSEGNEVANVLSNLEVVVKDSYTNTAYTSDLAGTEYFIKNVDGHYAFTPNAEADCTYTITYTYTDAITNLETTQVFEVKYEKEFDDSAIKLGYKFSGTMPESLELGVEKELPTVSVYDENNSELELDNYTEVSVVFVPNEANKSKYTLDADKDYVTVSNSNKVTPMYPTTEGIYKITYKISDFYNYAQGKVNKTLVYTINDVKDSTAPTTYAVEDYKDALIFDTVDTTKVVGIKDDFEAVDVSYKIPTKVATNTEVYLPAIFAKDNFTKYENMFSSLDRVIVPESGSNTVVTTCYKEVDSEMKRVSVKPYETASYKFTTPGTYTIRYEATDEAKKYNYTGLNFTIIVEDGFEDVVAPKITVSGIPSSIKAGETVSFVKPSIVDYTSETSTSTDVVDKNLEIGCYYYTGNKSNDELNAELAKARKGETSTLIEIKEDETSKKLSFVAPETNATVVVVAYDDAGNKRVETRTINVINISDSEAPTISTDSEDYVDEILSQDLKQDEIISLPDFVATDDNTKYLEGTVTVVDASGNKVSVIGAKYTTTDADMTISNARFVATKAGSYTINYTINDIGGNYVVKSYVISIADTKAPSIELDSSITSVEVGQTIKVPTITVKDNGEVLANAYTEIRFVGDNNPSYKFNNGTLEFTALETGVFTYEYFAKDGAGNETISGPYTIEAKDTLKPEITLDFDLNADKTRPIEKDNSENILPIEIPGFTAEDTLNGIKESRVEVLSPSEKTLKVESTAEGYSFVPTVDGVYTIKYIAIDNANNETVKSYSLRIGDNTDPSIKFEEEGLNDNAPEELKLTSSSKLDLDLTKISVSDNGTTKTAKDLTTEYTNSGYRMFTVSVTGPDGSTVSVIDGSDYEYKITQTGKYTITYTARDKAGNEKVIKKVVEVFADDNSSIISNETWSIVLIIGSLAVLAGVVIYFVKTRDKKPAAKKLPNNKEDK